jgi:hypothetical protein
MEVKEHTMCNTYKEHHSHCHCTKSNLCESPVIRKSKTVCNDGCCKTETTSILNSSEIVQYANSLNNAHCGTYRPVAVDVIPTLHHKGLVNTPIQGNGCGCNIPQSTICRPRGVTNNIIGSVCETIKEIPAAGVYIVNYEFVDLMVDRLLQCLNVNNLSPETIVKIDYYLKMYYENIDNLDELDSIAYDTAIDLDKELMLDTEDADRLRAILIAFDARIKGEVRNEQ